MLGISSVNLGTERAIQIGSRLDRTGIFKQPTTAPVEITPEGLAGDTVCDRKHHAGPDQAVYVYGGVDYKWWAGALSCELAPGTFGENLTIRGLASADFSIGDRLHLGAPQAGGVILEVSAPRLPCSTLAARMDDPGFVKRFRQAARPGLYCRVIRPGFVQSGDPVRVEPYPGATVTLLEMFQDAYEPRLEATAIRRFLDAPISLRARRAKEKQLKALSTGSST